MEWRQEGKVKDLRGWESCVKVCGWVGGGNQANLNASSVYITDKL